MPISSHIETCVELGLRQCVLCSCSARFLGIDGVCSSCHFTHCVKDNCRRCFDIAFGVITFLHDEPK